MTHHTCRTCDQRYDECICGVATIGGGDPKPASSEFDIRRAAPGYTYRSTKTYAHSVGLTCAFRQWRAESHCRFIHGYAIRVHFEFATQELDVRNWAVDFGSLKPLKGWLEDMFDHKTLVAQDDPQISIFREMEIAGLIQLRVVPSAGCEAMARIIFEYTEQWLKDAGYGHIQLTKVNVAEHEGNSAEYGVIG